MFLSFKLKLGFMHRAMEIGLKVEDLPKITTPLTPLTVLGGANGSGKSTFLRGILKMKQALEESSEVFNGRAGLWHCSYLLPDTSALLIYEFEWEDGGVNPIERFRWLNLAKAETLALDPGRSLSLWDLDLPRDAFAGLSLFQDHGAEGLNLALRESEWSMAAAAAVGSLRQSLLDCFYEVPGDDREQWSALPTSTLRHLASLVEGPYPRLDNMRRDPVPRQSASEIVHRIQAKDTPTAYEKLLIASLRNPDDAMFRARVDELSAAERRLFMITLPLLADGDRPCLVLCENPDERLFRENSEALALLLREAGIYQPGTQWILSSHFTSFLDAFYPREVWYFKASVSPSKEEFLDFQAPQNLGQDPLVTAMVDQGVPLSELAYGAYF